MSAPANDNYADAALISGDSGTVSGTNEGATVEGNDYYQKSVWYKWVAPSSGTVIFDALSSTPADQEINLWQLIGDDFASATTGEYSDYYGDGYLGKIQFAVTAGQTYHIRVAGTGLDSVVTFVLSWTMDVAAWEAAHSVTSGGGTSAPANDDYANAELIEGTNGTVNGTTIGATAQGRDGGDNWVWYKWTAPIAHAVTFDTLSSVEGIDTVLTVWNGPDYDDIYTAGPIFGNDDAAVGESRSQVTFDTGAGTTWWIGVCGYNQHEFDFVLSWSQGDPGTDPGTGNGDPDLTTFTLSDWAYENVLYNPLASEVWVLTLSPTQPIARLDEYTGAVKGAISGTKTYLGPMKYDQINGQIIVNDSTGFYRYNAFNGTLVNHFGSSNGHTWAISPLTGKVWASNGTTTLGTGTLSVWDADANTAVSYSVGASYGYPEWIMFPNDGSILFIAGSDAAGNTTYYLRLDPATGIVTQLYSRHNPVTYQEKFYSGDPRYDRTLNGIWWQTYTLNPAYTGPDGTEMMYLYTVEFFSLDSLTITKSYPVQDISPIYSDISPWQYDADNQVLWIAGAAPNANNGPLGTRTLYGYKTADGALYQSTSLNGSLPMSMTLAFGSVWMADPGSNRLMRVRIHEVKDGPINDRDVWLETFSNRFEMPTVQFGTQVNDAQFGAISTAVAAAKGLSLSASVQIFIIRDDPV